MNFEKAFKELKSGKKIRRKIWQEFQHLSFLEGAVKAYRGEVFGFYNDSSVLLSDDWHVVGENSKPLSFIEALEELKAKKMLRKSTWEPYRFIFVDSDSEIAMCQPIEYEFMPTFKDLCATDWEIMK